MPFLSAKEGISMENLFQLLVDAHGLSAWIQPIDIDELDGTVQPEMIHKLLADEKVIFGCEQRSNSENLQRSVLSGISHTNSKRSSCRKRQ
ncbi:hypothetical protein LG298_09290 [Cytobacillus firmus]|uniref:hypothetical protein n=1 Tax=Cytobacillus firmus TaxID=1399 RepID=UPI00384E950B